MRSILIIVPEEGYLFWAVGIADILARTNLALRARALDDGYQVTLASTQRHRVVHGRSGLHLMTDACLVELDPCQPRDTLLVTGRCTVDEESEVIGSWLRLAAPHAQRVASVCAGALVLGQAGLLDGRRATTHWQFQTELAQRFPTIRLQEDPMVVQDGPIWTSAGASTGFDLTLALVEHDHGAEVAREVAQDLVMYLHRPGGQNQFARQGVHVAREPGPIRDLQAWAQHHLAEDLSVEALAARAAMSPRNFARVFVRETGVTPARYVEELRLEAARQRLESSRDGLDEVAWSTGLASAQNLRRVLERHLGVSPTEYRQRFGRI